MARKNDWSAKVMLLLKAGNTSGAIAQIKVAPAVRDLQTLEADLARAQLAGRWRDVDAAVRDNLALLSAPRLHRSP